MPSKQQSRFASRWVDALFAALIFVTSLVIIIAGGHGLGVLGMFVLGDFSPSVFLSPWGAYSWVALTLVVSSSLPLSWRLIVRWIAIVATLVATWWFFDFSEWKIATATSSIPIILVALLLGAGTLVVHFKAR